jgi:hypothetical protein
MDRITRYALPLYNYCFATRSSHITTVYKLVQKLETKIKIFPVDDHRTAPSAAAPPSARVGGGHKEEEESGVSPAEAPG